MNVPRHTATSVHHCSRADGILAAVPGLLAAAALILPGQAWMGFGHRKAPDGFGDRNSICRAAARQDGAHPGQLTARDGPAWVTCSQRPLRRHGRL